MQLDEKNSRRRGIEEMYIQNACSQKALSSLEFALIIWDKCPIDME
jgi:hypothetical protein